MSSDSSESGNLPEPIEKLPTEDLQSELRRRGIESITVSQSFSGPIPPPEVLREYDSVHAGFAERIVSMAEREQDHRHDMESKAISGSISAEKRGQFFAFIICSVVILGSVFLVSIGQVVTGTILAGTTLGGLAYVFITGRNADKDQSDQ